MNTRKQCLRDTCKRGHFKGLLHRARSSKSNEVVKECFKPDLSQPLHYAAALGDLEVVKELIESYECDPLNQNLYGITPLHCASYCGKIDVVKYLQGLYGIDKIVVDQWGACPIVYCTYCAYFYTLSREVDPPLDYFSRSNFPSTGHVEIAKYLLGLRVQNTTLSPQLVHVLRLPMCTNSLVDFKDIIEILTQLELSIECNTEIYKCLRSAVDDNKWDFVRALLLAFPDQIKVAAGTYTSDIKDQSSRSFPRTLFDRADIDLIKLFLELKICDLKSNLLTLKWSIDRVPSCFELVQYLLESADRPLSVMDKHDKNSGHSCLLSYVLSLYKCKAREQRLVKLIADYGAEGIDTDGNTILHLACEYSTAFLVKHNYDQTALNNNRQMPLHIACEKGNLEMVKLVSSQPGFDVNLQDSAGDTPLHIACKSEWNKTDVLPCFRYLILEKRCSVNIQNNQKQLPLHNLLRSYKLTACEKGNLEIVKLVSSQPGLDVNLQDSAGDTPLHIACKSEWNKTDVLPCFRYLILEKRCSVNIQNNQKQLPLHNLLRSYKLTADMKESILSKLIEWDVIINNINAQDSDGMTLLHIACKYQNLNVVRSLMSTFQCDVNLLDSNGNLPLHYAVQSERWPYYNSTDALELVRLVSEGCTLIHAKNNSGITPLYIAWENENKDVVKFLVFHEKYPLNVNHIPASDIYANLDIHFACQKEEDIDLLKALANEQNVNRFGRLNAYAYGDEYGRRTCTPLHIACAYNNIPAVRLFGELHCDFSQKDSQNMLPLHITCSKSGSLECIKLLKIHMDDLKVVEWEGNTPLHLACKHNCTDIVKYLLAMYRCDLNIKNRWGELPLHLACSTSLEIVKRVSKCDTNCQTESGNTPLHIACKAGVLDIVKYLVQECKCRHSMTLYNKSQKLPVHYACDHNSLEMVKLVAQSCSTQNLITKTGAFEYMSALDIACFHGFVDIATYFINKKGCSLSALKGDQSALEYASGTRKREDTFFHNEPKDDSETFHPDVVKYLIAECNYDPCASIGSSYSYVATLIRHACQKKNLELLKALTVCSVDIKDSEGNTPLHRACEYSCVEIVQFLVDCGCDQTIINNNGELALHLACRCKERSDSLIITQTLTKCDVNTLTFGGNTPIHIACSEWNEDVATYLIEEAKCDVNIPDKEGNYALHIACLKSLRVTELILQNYDVNCTNADGNTALHIACTRRRNCEFIVCLLKNELCRADIPNKSGDLPLHSFVSYEHDQIGDHELQSVTELLVDRCIMAIRMSNHEGYTPVQIAVMNGKLDFLQLLHQKKKIDFTGTGSKTLIHIACKYRQVQIVRWMLDHGTDLNIPDEEGNYPEHLCIDDNNSELKLKVEKQYEEAERNRRWKKLTSRLYSEESGESDDQESFPKHLFIGEDNPSLNTLIELGVVYIHKQNKDGNTILHIACQDDRAHILQHVLSTSDCIDAFTISNNDGDTPLHLLATREMKSLNSILPLIKCKNPNIKNKHGNTPLHVACRNSNIEFATFLFVDLHCDLNVTNDSGEIPLHLAASKSIELMELVATAENVNSQRNDGDTPLHIACRHRQLDVILHLIDNLNCSIQILNNNEDSPFHILLEKNLGQSNFLLEYIPHSESNRKNKSGDTLLHVACQYSTISTVSFLTKSRKYKTNIINESGATPLHFACSRGFINMVRLVSKCNPLAQVNNNAKLKDFKFVQGDTPLHIACRDGNVNVVKYLLNNGHAKALRIYNEQGDLPFHLACQHGDNMVRPFIKYVSIFDRSAVNLSGDTPLHIACTSKCTPAIIKRLVNEMNCKTNIVNKNGDLPLHIVCQSRRTSRKMVNILCSGLSQENLTLQNVSGNTALHELLKHTYEKHETYTYFTLNTHDERTSWIQRLKETIKYVVERMPRIDIPDKKGEHPIHLACQYQAFQVVKFLCEQFQGSLPEGILHKACLNEYSSVLIYLIKNFELDHHVNIPNKNGDLPLHIAAKQRHVKGVELLIKKTLNVNYTNHQGNTPVHELYSGNCTTSSTENTIYSYSSILSDDNRLKILNTLLENDVSFSIQNLMGQTPLHCIAARYSDLNVVISKKQIDVNVQDKKDHTPLHIACQANQLKCVELLLSAGADASIKDKQGQTAITLTKEPEIIKLLIEHGADPQAIYDLHREYFETYSSDTPPPTPAKLLVIGDPSVGKTTLVQSLRNEGSENVVSDKFDHTTGIVTTTFRSKIYGDVKFFDFAGQPEYYASHDGFLHSILKNVPPVVLILVDLTESKKKLQYRLHYWINFVENRCVTFSDATHIIIVCSHADCLVDEGKDPREKVSKLHQSIVSEFEDRKLIMKDIIHINCKLSYSEEIVRLQQALKESTNELRQEGEMHINSHCFYVLLLQTFGDCKVITLGHIVSKLKVMSRESDRSPLFLVQSDRNAVIQMCKELDDKGHIMYLEHPSVTDKSWLILDTQPLLHDLVGTLFAPSSFPQHRPLSYSTGVVPLSLFKKYIGEQDSYTASMLLTFLTRLEYCREVTDKVLLDSIVKQEGYLETEKYYFFPNLVSRDRPNDKWSTGSKYSYQCGWLLQCKKEGDFFSPHFIQVLLLRLTFAFAPKKVAYDSRDFEDSEDESDEEENQAMALVIKRTCSVWKNGLYWQQSGMKTIIDIIDQRTLVLLMQCHQGRELQLLMRRSMIMSMALDAKKEFSSKSKVIEYFMHPQCVRHPLTISSISKCRLFSFPQIEQCIINRDPCITNDVDDEVDLRELLLFEPYFEFSTDVIQKLSNEATFHEHANNDLLSMVAGDIDRRYHPFFKNFSHTLGVRITEKAATDELHRLVYTLKQILKRKKPSGATRRDVHEFFNQMSIFYGRHPSGPQVYHEPLSSPRDSVEIDTNDPHDSDGALSMSSLPKLHQIDRIEGNGKVIKVIETVAAKWEKVATRLYFDHNIIDRIKRDGHYQSDPCCRKMFGEWLGGKGRKPVNWQTLITALKEADCSALACGLEDIFS